MKKIFGPYKDDVNKLKSLWCT